jgi:hypothetical protein
MKRRSFIVGSFLSLVGAGVFAFMQWMRNSSRANALAQPRFLSQLCDSSTIRSLGLAYLKLRPNETKEEVLLNDLLAENFQRDHLENSDMVNAESEIEKRIKSDFATDNIVVVQGWVLSITEARQCAFFSKLNV